MALQMTKTGLLINSNINEIHIEPDGSKWEHVFHHNNPSVNLFSLSDKDNMPNGVYKNENLWFNFQICNKIESNWEFLYIQKIKKTDKIVKYRWIQSVNPFNATYDNVKPTSVTRITTSGYTNGTFGGFWKRNSESCFVIANDTASNWFGATGSWTAYQGGIPGYPRSTVTTGCIDVFVRIDSLINNNAKFYKDGIQVVENIYEY